MDNRVFLVNDVGWVTIYTTTEVNGQLKFGLDTMSDLYTGRKMIVGTFTTYRGEHIPGTVQVNLRCEQCPKCKIQCASLSGSAMVLETPKSKTGEHYVHCKQLLNSIGDTLNKNGLCNVKLAVISCGG